MIAIIDFGAGNLKSAVSAFKHFHSDTVLYSKASDLPQKTHALVLPGDGSMPYCMEQLEKRGFKEYILNHRDIPLFGICVGFQMLFSETEEDGGCEGLGLIPGTVRRFKPILQDQKVPHIGWNTSKPVREHFLVDSKEHFYYYVHSYYAQTDLKEDTLLRTEYIKPFSAAAARENVCGTQFHPEKSHQAGWDLLKRFVDEVVS